MPGPIGAVGVLSIDLDALANNWRSLVVRAAPAECGAVVKANAYGIGIEAAAPALYAAGCRTFFVAALSEGARVRAAVGEDAVLYILNGLEAGADPRDYLAIGARPVIGSPPEAARWIAAAGDRPAPCAVHIDTGMNRLGFADAAEARAAFGDRLDATPVALLMSHFAASEEPDNPLNAVQIARFEEARAGFPGVPASLANSSGFFLRQRPFFDLVRPGYALYGGNPTPGRPNPMQTVVTLEIPVQQTRWIEPGETVGYNAQWTARRRTRLATLLAGYADGLPRTAGGTVIYAGAEVAIAGRRCPLVGRMSMDLCVADVTDLPEVDVGPGVVAQVFGDQIGVDELGARCGTIGYHILTSLGSRYARVYRGG